MDEITTATQTFETQIKRNVELPLGRSERIEWNNELKKFLYYDGNKLHCIEKCAPKIKCAFVDRLPSFYRHTINLLRSEYDKR